MQRDVLIMTIYVLGHNDIEQAAVAAAADILAQYPHKRRVLIYPVPRGGVPATYMLLRHLPNRFRLADSPAGADMFFDDLVDSGRTKEHYQLHFPDKPFFALFGKDPEDSRWLVFPWEGTEQRSADDVTIRLLQYIGEDVTRDGLKKTPDRVSRAWREWCSGYNVDVAALFQTFDGEGYGKLNGGTPNDEMILQRALPFYSHCEHHLAPFFGTADIAYIPGETGRIVGLSKLSRVLDAYARRLQVQERLTTQVAEAIETHLQARGVAVRITARHLCMESRGIHKQGHDTVTQVCRGAFFTDHRTRAEFTGMLR